MMSENSEEKKLVELIRKVCREQIASAIDQHLSEYKHEESVEEVIEE